MKRLFLLIFVPVFFFSCQTKPEPVPEWVSHLPEASSEEIYFTAAGSVSSGSADEARTNAEAALIQKIITSMEIQASSDSDPQALKAFEELQSKLADSLTGTVSDRGCIRIIDQYKSEDNTRVYILASCSKQLFDEEKRMLHELFSVQRSSIINRESEGDRLFKRGSYFRASLKFLEAASEAYASGLTSKQKIEKEMLDKALKCLDNMTINIKSDSLTVMSGHDFPEVLKGFTAPGYMPLKISLFRNHDAASDLLQTESVISGRHGLFEFLPAFTELTGNYSVTVFPDYSSHSDLLKNYTDEFQSGVKNKTAVYTYTVDNPDKNIVLGLSILDVGSGRIPVYNKAASGMQYLLKEKGYNPVLLNSDGIERGSEPRIMIRGKARFSGFSIKDKKISVRVKGSAFVTDNEQNNKEILNSGDLSVSAEGDSLESASNEAFYQFGLLAGEKILEAYSSY